MDRSRVVKTPEIVTDPKDTIELAVLPPETPSHPPEDGLIVVNKEQVDGSEPCPSPLIETVMSEVDSYDFLMGWGKTTMVLRIVLSALSGEDRGERLLVAFKTRKSILEFLWRIRVHFGRDHFGRISERFTQLYSLDDSAAGELAKEFYKSTGDKKQYEYIKKQRAYSCPNQVTPKCRVILTTHESAAITGTLFDEYHAVFDEIPEWALITRDRFSALDDELLRKSVETSSVDLMQARGLGKKLVSGMFDAYTSGEGKVFQRAWLFNGQHPWKSMIVLAAFPEFSDMFLCGLANPGRFTFSCLNPQSARLAMLSLITWEKVGDYSACFSKCSTRKARALHKQMEEVVKAKNGLMVHFKKNHSTEVLCIINGMTGSNLLRHVDTVGVAALKFYQPWVSEVFSNLFDSREDQREWELCVSAVSTLQSIFRSAIRDGKKITVCYFDDRVKEYITKILSHTRGDVKLDALVAALEGTL